MDQDVIVWRPIDEAAHDHKAIFLKLVGGTITMGHWSGEINPNRPWVYIEPKGGLNPRMPMVMARCGDKEVLGWAEIPK